MIFLIESIILCALFTIAVPFKLMRDPIKGIMSYPTAIRRRVESLPQYQGTIRQEERAHMGKKLAFVPIVAAVLAVLGWLSGAHTFFPAFLHGFGLFMVVNLFDLVVLDWLWFCRSPKVRLPGTEDMEKEYRDPWFHLRGFAKGIVIGLFISLLAAGMTALVSALLP